MKVRELIQHLQTLDQDKGIWLIYDTYFASDPIPDDELISAGWAEYLSDEDKEVREGDYQISVG